MDINDVNELNFDDEHYLSTYSDVAEAGIDPYWHFKKYGEKEGRLARKRPGGEERKKIFNDRWYRTRYKDVAKSGMDPYAHYLKYGKAEGRLPSPLPVMIRVKSVLKRTPVVGDLLKYTLSKTALINRYLLTRLNGSTQNIKAINALNNKRDLYINHYSVDVKRNPTPEIDMTVVLYNNGRWLDGFINSLLEQNYNTRLIKLMLIDNGSTDDTLQVAKCLLSLKPKFRDLIIIESTNIGFGAGHDLGISHGSADLIMISNVDVVFHKDSITNMMKFISIDGESKVASWEFKQLPYEHPKYYDPITYETNWSAHACIIISRSAYEAVGGYDPKIFMYAEDVELSYRFRSHGYVLRYNPEATITHYTYEETNQIKPVQYGGSLLGNAYIRLRYGNLEDRIAIRFLYRRLGTGREAFPGAFDIIEQNKIKLKENKSYFKGEKPKLKEGFHAPFRGFDYELTREGAFHRCEHECDSSPLVSVIVRTYRGRGKLLKQCLMSLYNQTYKNIEVIVVEDGGATHKEVILHYEKLFGNKLRYFSLEKVGRSVTGNRGLFESKGLFCMFLDDDDLVFQDHVSTLVNPLINDLSLSATYALSFEVKTEYLNENKDYLEHSWETLDVYKQEFDYVVLLHHNYFPIQTVLFRRDCYEQMGGFDERLEHLEDWNLWLRYAYNRKFKFIEKTTSIYRVPWEADVHATRHKELENAYDKAKKYAEEACRNKMEASRCNCGSHNLDI